MKNKILCISLAVVLALSVGLIGCVGEEVPEIQEYNLTISSTEGGSVTTPGEGTFTYDEGEIVNLVAEGEEGYEFIGWINDVGSIADINAASTSITMDGHYLIIADFAIGIRDWHDLDAIRDNLGDSYVLMNDLDSTSVGYMELASPTANQGDGWQPIGTFTGSFDGQGYEIRDLFIDRPVEDDVGLFSRVAGGGTIKNLGVVNAQVTGDWSVGGLVGTIDSGTVSKSHFAGSVTGTENVGGLVGRHEDGTLVNSYCTGSVTGNGCVGGLVGTIGRATLSNSHFAGTVTGAESVSGLVGWNYMGIVSNSHYNYDDVLINGQNTITVGALYAEDFEQWFATDKFLDVNERLSREDGYYLIKNISDFKQLLAFGQDDSLKFRLESDLDLADEPNFYVPYLAARFNGNGHKISNLTLNLDSISHVGLFGFIDSGGGVNQVSLENVSISGGGSVGGLVGSNRGMVGDSYSSGSVTGGTVGGLVGDIQEGTLSNSYFRGSVTGQWVGGLVGEHVSGTVRNSYYNYDEVLINGGNVITIGALFDEDFEQWLANGKFLDVNERLSQEDAYYVINDVSDFKQLLAFGQDSSLKFRLENDLDLASEPGLYIPYLAGEFDGNGRKVSNLSFDSGFDSDSFTHLGLFGVLGSSGRVEQVGVESVNITGGESVGGLVGANEGTVTNSYSTGIVSGSWAVGGLVGYNSWGAVVSNSYSNSIGSVSGGPCGGLVGQNHGTVSNSYSTGSITGDESVGGLVGASEGYVSHSFWDTENSGQATSAGGTGKTTVEMQDIATFTAARWDIIGVADANTRNTSYIWNIVDDESYPFMSWQSVS